MAQKPSIAKGTRDFGPEEVAKRQYIFDTIKKQFQLFGFLPIETPSFENIETLTGKYGEEGDQLIFKILRSGDFISKANSQSWEQKDASALANQIADKALRYDLTVPFARFVVQHQNDLAFPFKRYQIQPVWRADRPQKGRFREFYQCDADVIGSKSLWQEVELVKLYDDVFSALDLDVTIRINNRKILAGIAEVFGMSSRFAEFTIALDKLDKVGVDGVIAEMQNRGFDKAACTGIQNLLGKTSSSQNTLTELKQILSTSAEGTLGLKELDFVFEKIEILGLKKSAIVFDLTLARGLNYYTGAIFEVVANDVQMGSIGGGGRYDDLTGVFGLQNMSGIGISFGVDRIYICLEEKNLFPKSSLTSVDVLFLNFGEAESVAAMQLIEVLRNGGISAELYPDPAKVKKQFDYAAKKGIKHAIFLGEAEILKGCVNAKNIETGEQNEVLYTDLIAHLKNA